MVLLPLNVPYPAFTKYLPLTACLLLYTDCLPHHTTAAEQECRFQSQVSVSVSLERVQPRSLFTSCQTTPASVGFSSCTLQLEHQAVFCFLFLLGFLFFFFLLLPSLFLNQDPNFFILPSTDLDWDFTLSAIFFVPSLNFWLRELLV